MPRMSTRKSKASENGMGSVSYPSDTKFPEIVGLRIHVIVPLRPWLTLLITGFSNRTYSSLSKD
jgi:hypothetical protein